jgi:hypothetical protein
MFGGRTVSAAEWFHDSDENDASYKLWWNDITYGRSGWRWDYVITINSLSRLTEQSPPLWPLTGWLPDYFLHFRLTFLFFFCRFPFITTI